MRVKKTCVYVKEDELTLPSLRSSYYIARVGHFLECFNATLYGCFAVILSPLFFPQGESILQAYAAFSVGFLARPIGAILWGAIGDRYGRRIAFSYSIILSGIPPLIMGCLPSYDTIGIYAPLALFFARIMQGVCYGGEQAGVAIYIFENQEKNRSVVVSTCYVLAFGVLGAASGAFLGAASMFIADCWWPQASSWGWRVPFLCGGALTLGLYYVRQHFVETRDYQNFLKHAKDSAQKLPSEKPIYRGFVELIVSYYPQLLLTILCGGLSPTLLYYATVFGNHLFKMCGYTGYYSLLFNGATLLLDAAMILCFGFCSSIFGLRRQMMFSLGLIALAPLIGFLIFSGDHLKITDLLFFISFLVIAGSSLAGAGLLYVTEIFPMPVRYLGLSMGSNMGVCLIGGNSVVAFEFLTKHLGMMGPALLISALALMTLAALLWVMPAVHHEHDIPAPV